MRPLLVPFLPLFAIAAAAGAQTSPSGPPVAPVDAATSAAVVQSLAHELRARYVFPDVADAVAKALAAKQAHGGYASATTSTALADALTADLRATGKDAHFRVRYAPGFQAPPADDAKPLSPAAVVEAQHEAAQQAYGISRVQRLPGNIGYLDLRGFGPTEFVAGAFESAISLLSGADALIIDLRQNGGGEPQSVTELISHFYAEGESRHLNDLYFRADNTTRAFWTNPAAKTRYTGPIWLLTSHDTFSGGEEFAYDLQTQKRATLVGDTTGGGANPGDRVKLAQGYVAFIPTGRAINPITMTNWEHVGVVPNVPVPAAEAMKTAYVAVLKSLLATATDPEQRDGLSGTLARVEKDEIQLPTYTPRR